MSYLLFLRTIARIILLEKFTNPSIFTYLTVQRKKCNRPGEPTSADLQYSYLHCRSLILTTHSPQAKLLEFFVAHLAGYKHLQDISLSAHPLDKDWAWSQAGLSQLQWGQSSAVQMRVGLRTVLDEGWLAFDSIKLTSLSAPIAVRPEQDHTLAVQINGQLEGANAARLFIHYSDGTIGTVWQNESGFNGSQSVSGDFTTPAGVGSFQVGTEVSLDQGYLSWTNVTLTAYSAAFSVTAGHTYQFTGQVTGTLAASLGQGGRITAVYANGETLLWQNPANFSGTTTVQRTFTGNDSGAPTRLALTAVLDAGHLAFGDIDLQYLTAGDIIRRSTYMLAGQAVAVRVSGDPEGHDGLYYLYSDHLGSASAMTDANGSLVGGRTRYYPFGGYRTAPTAQQSAISDRGFTGHKSGENGGGNDLGFIYMNARFFVVSPYQYENFPK